MHAKAGLIGFHRFFWSNYGKPRKYKKTPRSSCAGGISHRTVGLCTGLRRDARSKRQQRAADGCHLLYSRWNRGRSRGRLIDYFSIDEAAMKRIANLHLALNLGALVIFSINLWLRFRLPAKSYLPLGMSIVGVLAIGIGGWLGGEMVFVKGMISRLFLPASRRLRPPSKICSMTRAWQGDLDAVQKTKELRPDVVLLDLALPQLPGLRIAELLRKDFPSVRIVIMSEQDPSVLAHFEEVSGLKPCIAKSSFAAELIPTLRNSSYRFRVASLSRHWPQKNILQASTVGCRFTRSLDMV
jgi:CheY-like chemotaxis protein